MGATRLAVLTALAVPLAACMTAAGSSDMEPAPPPAADSCRAEPAQSFIGAVASSETAAQLLRATGAREIRWVPPGTMVTMEYKYGRLTVGYDGQMKITSIACS